MLRRTAARTYPSANAPATRLAEDPGEQAAWLRGTIDAVLAGTPADPAETKPVGCSVKWKG